MKTRDHIKTCILVAIVLFFAVQQDFSFVVPVLVFYFLLWAFYNIIRMTRKHDERKRRSIRLAIWFFTVALVVAVQSYWAAGLRNEADIAMKAVVAYKSRTGGYPASLKEVGLDEERLHDQWSIRYFVRDGKPVLAYDAPFMPLSTQQYDFEKNAWWLNAY